jgi:hypothetical protein
MRRIGVIVGKGMSRVWVIAAERTKTYALAQVS